MALLVALLALVVVPMAHIAAMALASLGVARAFGVRGGKLAFKHPPREAFDERSRWAFAATVAAGPIASYLCAAALAFGGLLVGGGVEYDGTVEVVSGGRADAAGIRSGDRIVMVDSTPIGRFDDIRTALGGRPDTRLPVVVERAGQQSTFEVVTDESGRIQVKATAPRAVAVPIGEAVATAIASPVRVMVAVAAGFVEIVAPRERATLMGPVGIVKETSRAAGSERGSLLSLLAVLSSYCWPLTLVVAYGTRPRRRPSSGAEKRS